MLPTFPRLMLFLVFACFVSMCARDQMMNTYFDLATRLKETYWVVLIRQLNLRRIKKDRLVVVRNPDVIHMPVKSVISITPVCRLFPGCCCFQSWLVLY